MKEGQQQWKARVRATVPFMWYPTVQALRGEFAETSCRKLAFEPTFRLGCTAHVVPFQCSIKVRATPPFVSWKPTAHAFVDEVAATAMSWSCTVPMFGLDPIVHELPFQCSIRVLATSPAVQRTPTAQALEEDVTVTSFKPLSNGPTIGLDRTFHDVPFQCSIRAWSALPLKWDPTAQTLFAEAVATP